MTRVAVLVDRVLVLAAGTGLVAGGLAAVLWWHGELGRSGPLSFSAARAVIESDWWPWASGLGGVLLILIGLRWLAGHRPARRATRAPLSSGGSTRAPGVLSVDVGSVADAAAAELAGRTGIAKATGRATVEKGISTITVTVTIPPGAALSATAEAADDVAAVASRMVGGDIAIRTVVRVEKGRRRPTVS